MFDPKNIDFLKEVVFWKVECGMWLPEIEGGRNVEMLNKGYELSAIKETSFQDLI